MTKELREIRNNLCYQVWEQYKGRWTMLQLAEIFNIPLPSFYKIVKGRKTKCNHKEWEEHKGEKFCKKCGDILSSEICKAPGCMRYGKPKGIICIE